MYHDFSCLIVLGLWLFLLTITTIIISEFELIKFVGYTLG